MPSLRAGGLVVGLVCAFALAGASEARSHHHRHHASASAVAEGSSSDYYTNVSGHQVHRPVHASTAPAGASAKCGDGTYSFSEHRQGTCSPHGGVSSWLGH